MSPHHLQASSGPHPSRGLHPSRRCGSARRQPRGRRSNHWVAIASGCHSVGATRRGRQAGKAVPPAAGRCRSLPPHGPTRCRRPRRFQAPTASISTELHATRWRVVGTGDLIRPTYWLAGRSAFRRTRRLRGLALGRFGGCSHLFPLICYEKGVHDAADDRLLLLEARRGTTDHQQPYLARSRR